MGYASGERIKIKKRLLREFVYNCRSKKIDCKKGIGICIGGGGMNVYRKRAPRVLPGTLAAGMSVRVHNPTIALSIIYYTCTGNRDGVSGVYNARGMLSYSWILSFIYSQSREKTLLTFFFLYLRFPKVIETGKRQHLPTLSLLDA